jgi:hypothetical protein
MDCRFSNFAFAIKKWQDAKAKFQIEIPVGRVSSQIER